MLHRRLVVRRSMGAVALSVLAFGLADEPRAHAAEQNSPEAAELTPQVIRHGHWEPYRSPPGKPKPAGIICPFTLASEIVEDDEWIRVDSTYPDGTNENFVIKGTLVIRFINVESGRSIVADLSGTAWIHRHQNELQDWVVVGPFGGGFRFDNPYHRPGYYVFDGFTVMTMHDGGVTPEGKRIIHGDIVLHEGKTLDVCAALL